MTTHDISAILDGLDDVRADVAELREQVQPLVLERDVAVQLAKMRRDRLASLSLRVGVATGTIGATLSILAVTHVL